MEKDEKQFISDKNRELGLNQLGGKTDIELYDEKTTGTTILALVYDGGVILGADCRSSSGIYVANRVADKIYPITSNIFGLKTGSSADTQFLLTQVKNYMSQFEIEYGDKPPVKVAARILQQFLYQYKQYLNGAIIIGGVDNLEGPSVYEIGMGGTVIKRDIGLNGSGSYYITSYVDKNFKKNMTKQEAKEFLIQCVTLAIYRDHHSGGMVRILDITKEGYTRDCITFNNLNFPQTQ